MTDPDTPDTSSLEIPAPDVRSWDGDFDPIADAEERRVLFATLDSFRYSRLLLRIVFLVCLSSVEHMFWPCVRFAL